MKKILVILLVVGAGAYFYFNKQSETRVVESKISPDVSAVVDVKPQKLIPAIKQAFEYKNSLTQTPFWKRVFGDAPVLELPEIVYKISNVEIISKDKMGLLSIKSTATNEIKQHFEREFIKSFPDLEIKKVDENNFTFKIDEVNSGSISFNQEEVLALLNTTSKENFYTTGEGFSKLKIDQDSFLNFYIDYNKLKKLDKMLGATPGIKYASGNIKAGSGVRWQQCTGYEEAYGYVYQGISNSRSESFYKTINSNTMLAFGVSRGYLALIPHLLRTGVSEEGMAQILKDPDAKEAYQIFEQYESMIREFPFEELNIFAQKSEGPMPSVLIHLAGAKEGADQYLSKVAQKLSLDLVKDEKGRDSLSYVNDFPIYARYLDDGSILISQGEELTFGEEVDYFKNSISSFYVNTPPIIETASPFAMIYSMQNPEEFDEIINRLKFKLGANTFPITGNPGEMCFVSNFNIL